MSHTFTCRGRIRYRYYTCTNATKRGRRNCPTKSLPAAEIERVVVDQIRCIGQDPELLAETLKQARGQTETAIGRLSDERRLLERGLTRYHAELRRLGVTTAPDRTADLHDKVRQTEQRLAESAREIAELKASLVTDSDVAAAFADFDNVWQSLSPREQARILQLLIARVEFDASDSTIEVSLHATGIKTLSGGAMENAA